MQAGVHFEWRLSYPYPSSSLEPNVLVELYSTSQAMIKRRLPKVNQRHSCVHVLYPGLGLDLDVMVLDLEDGVARSEKNAARMLIPKTLMGLQPSKRERTVRINAARSEME